MPASKTCAALFIHTLLATLLLLGWTTYECGGNGALDTPVASRRSLLSYEIRYPLFVPRMKCRDDDGWDNVQFGSSKANSFDECAAACDDQAECSGIMYGNYYVGDDASDSRCNNDDREECTCYLVLAGCSHPETHLGYNIYMRDVVPTHSPTGPSLAYTQSYERAECRDANGAAVDEEYGTGFVSFDECAAACHDLSTCHGIMYGNYLAENSECVSADQTSCTCRLVTGECSHPIPHEGFNIFTAVTASPITPITTTPTAWDVTLRFSMIATESVCRDGGDFELGDKIGERLTFEECAAACDADADCYAFIYGLHTNTEWNRCLNAAGTSCHCWTVYNSCATTELHTGYNVYRKNIAARQPELFTLSHEGQWCRTSTGGTPNGHRVGDNTMEECEAACANNPQCSGFTFGVYRVDGDRQCVSAAEAHCDCYVYYEECGSYEPSVGHNLYQRTIASPSIAPTTALSTYEMRLEGAFCRDVNGDAVAEEYGDGGVSFDDCVAACQMSGGNGGGSIHPCHGIMYGDYLAENSECVSADQTSCTCMLVTGECSHPIPHEGFNIYRRVAALTALLGSPEQRPEHRPSL